MPLKRKECFFSYRNKIHRNRIIPRKIIKEFFSCVFVETAFENEVHGFAPYQMHLVNLHSVDDVLSYFV